MSKEKQIEEMAEILAENCGCCDNCEYSGILNDGIDCTEYKYADMLYTAGCRKQSEGEWIYQEYSMGHYVGKCSLCECEADMTKYCPQLRSEDERR